jgi:regulatory protein SWI6
VQKSQDLIAGTRILHMQSESYSRLPDMTAMIQGLNSDFSAEIKAKQDSLDVTQAHLRAATRELSEQRKQIQRWQASCAELDQVNQRAQNLDKALKNEDQFDWTGRTDLDKNDARDSAGPAFQRRGTSSTITGIGSSMDISFNVDIEPPMPTTDSIAGLIRLKRLKMWHMRMEEMMDARLKSLQGASAEKEYQCKKIVALCTRLHPDQVEEASDWQYVLSRG